MIRQILAIADKEFRHIMHDRLALVLTFGLPIFQLILYGYALDTRIRHLPAAVLNHDSHEAGRQLERRISRSALFSVQRAFNSEAEIESAMRAGSIRVAIEIPSGYTSNLIYNRRSDIRVWVDGSDAVSSNYVLSALDALGFEETIDHTRQVSAALPAISSVAMQPKVLFNPDGRTAVFLIPGLLAILIQMITTLLLALSMTTEREKGTLEQMLVTRMGGNVIIAGKCVAIGCIGILECCSLVLVMRYLFGIEIQGSVMLLIATFPLLVLAPIGIGLLIAARARNQLHALQLTHLVFLPSVMLSGFVIPREFLNPPIGWISNVLPATYLVAVARNLIVRGASFGETLNAVAAAATLGISLMVAGWYAMQRSFRSSE
jgi:ABC-type multidrug transport system permease subunit